jgi:4-guanidinobutyraldehyde dehydrogenase/NAD-dependent aldehyde dehydrogenase
MTTLTRADWEQRAQQLKIEGRAFINGEYTDAASGETFECMSPVDGRFLAKVASCDLADASAPWKTPAPPSIRRLVAPGTGQAQSQADPLRRPAAQHVEELALLETLDMGKPIGDSSSIDVPGAARP